MSTGLIIGLSVGGGLLLVLTITLLIVFLGFGGKNTESSKSMDDGSPITIYNPRFRRGKRDGMVLLFDYKFNKGAPSRREAFRLEFQGDRSGSRGADYSGHYPMYGARMSKKGTYRIAILISSERQTFDVKIVMFGTGLKRVSNYLPITIPRRDADLPDE